MRRQLSQPQVKFSLPTAKPQQPPGTFRRNPLFCGFHNTWGTHIDATGLSPCVGSYGFHGNIVKKFVRFSLTITLKMRNTMALSFTKS